MSNSVLIENNFPETEYPRCQVDAIPPLESEIISRYEKPSKHSVFPLEYAFYLLGAVHGKTVIAVRNDEISATILSSCGAHVISGDIADGKIILPADDGKVDRVFCGPILRQVDPIVTARQIRRVLKPGGSAVFTERIDNAAMARFKTIVPSECSPIASPRILTPEQAHSVSRAVGIPGRSREFGLIAPLLTRMGCDPLSTLARMSQQVDAALLRRWSFLRRFALQLVWEARKEC